MRVGKREGEREKGETVREEGMEDGKKRENGRGTEDEKDNRGRK